MSSLKGQVCVGLLTLLCLLFTIPDIHLAPPENLLCNGGDTLEETFEEVVSKYLSARRSGLSQYEITHHVFNVSLPNLSPEPGLLHSFPFLTGNTLMARADWVYECQSVPSLNLSFLGLAPIYTGKTAWRRRGPKTRMEDGDIIFLRSGDIENFAKELHPNIHQKYILVSHKSDISVPTGPYSRHLLESEKLLRWYAQNPSLTHPKLQPLPIGIQRREHEEGGGQLEIWEDLLGVTTKRDIQLYVNLSPRNRDFGWDRLRFRAWSAVRHAPFAHVVGVSEDQLDSADPFQHYTMVSPKQYLDDLTRSKFVLSPPGIGEDCFRTWESILLGAVPVVMKSPGLDPLWKEAPVLALEDLTTLSIRQMDQWSKRGKGRELALATHWFRQMDLVRAEFL